MVKDGEILRAELTQGLSQGQADALMLMIEFLGIIGPDMFVLKGYAGTGKTYLVQRLVSHILNTKGSNTKIAITAPTNKAVQELLSRKEFKGNNISYQTIHSLLGLTESISDSGKVTFTSKGDAGIGKIKYLIVDETSMLQDEIFDLLKVHSKNVKIIFMGDPAQIPPVGKKDCIPFKTSLSQRYEEGYELTEIMRQSQGNPIIENSFILRDNLNVATPIPVLRTQKDDKGHGVVHLDPRINRDEFLLLLEDHFTSAKFKADANYAKVIAWRNRTVATVNNHIRHTIYKEEQELKKIMPGEMILANKPIFDGEAIQFNTSEELEIRSYVISGTTLRYGGKTCVVQYYDCHVIHDRPMLNVSNRIKVLHEDSVDAYNKFLADLKERAITLKGKNKSWFDYYDAVKWPADIAYNYAITAHKSQGSTYRNVFLMEDDLNANQNVVERNRIKYTSYSRASHNLYIYRTNPI